MLQPYILFVTSSGSLICARVQYDSNKAILHPTLLPYRMIPSSQPSRKPNTKNFQSKKTTYYDIITIPATKIPKYYFLPSGRLPPSLPLSLPLSRTKDTPVDHHTSTTNETPPPLPPKTGPSNLLQVCLARSADTTGIILHRLVQSVWYYQVSYFIRDQKKYSWVIHSSCLHNTHKNRVAWQN